MEYNRIIAVTGVPGLFELVSSKTDGAVVRSLDDQTTRFVSSRVHQFSHLESIEIYTVRENVNLVDLFSAMKASNKALPAEKDAAAVKQYFQDVYPNLDFERVYASDMKKMVKWFSIIQKANISLEEPAAEAEAALPAEAEVAVAEASPEAVAPKPKKSAKKKSTEA